MPPRKRLLLSAYCEAVAKKVARGEAVPAPELANALKEAQEHLASSLHLRDTNEWRMCLALLSAATETAPAMLTASAFGPLVKRTASTEGSQSFG